MIKIRRATIADVPGIVRVCSAGFRFSEASQHLRSSEEIEKSIATYYNPERVAKDVTAISERWRGYFVAVDTQSSEVVGSGIGCLTQNDPSSSILLALYLDPTRRREGIGSALLTEITRDLVTQGASEQWVYATKGNELGIPFYQAMGFEFVREEQPTWSTVTCWVAKRPIK